jgi:hypothetical protein
MGLRACGKQFREPAATQLEYEDARGLKYTVIAFDAPYVGLPVLTRGVELVRSFLGYPMVVGLVELSHADPANGRFGYPTGPCWTLKELLRANADLNRTIGLRAGLELAWLVGQILVEAAENGAVQGCFAHGSLTPWRIALRPEGDVVVFGHGVPQVDVLAHREDPSVPVTADSVRYAPPERLAGAPEDLAADTAALTAIVYEVVTGQPLYGGHDLEAVSRAVGLAEGATTLSRSTDKLPPAVAQVFARSLLFDPESRLSGSAWLAEIAALHERYQDGDSLVNVAERMRGAAPTQQRRAARFLGTQTSYYTPEQLAAVAESSEPADAAPTSKVETRWSKPVRRGSEPELTDGPPADETAPRRRRRLRESEDSRMPSDEASEMPSAEEEPEAAGELIERTRRRADASPEPLPGRRRRRRLEDSGT